MKKITLLTALLCISYMHANDTNKEDISLPDLKSPVMRHGITGTLGYLTGGFFKVIIPNATIRVGTGIALLAVTEYFRSRNELVQSKSSTTPENTNKSSGIWSDICNVILASPKIYNALLYGTTYIGYALVFSHPCVEKHLEATNKYIGSTKLGNISLLKDNHVYAATEAGVAGLIVGAAAAKIFPTPTGTPATK